MPERPNSALRDQVLEFVRRHELLRAGDRVALAVSGGADSIALLRLLLELRASLGVVLLVVHFNHQIRGADSDADEQFVAGMARAHGLEFHRGSGDVPAHARNCRLSLETAARALRYDYFHQVLATGIADRLATAHTLDDQAETVLLRLLRGAGTKGLAGIYPAVPVSGAQVDASAPAIVRPLLPVQRRDLLPYLQGLGQPWREDASNHDLAHARNRVRHRLLPLLEQEFNPAIRGVLAEAAELARSEEAYWGEAVRRERAALLLAPSAPGLRSLPLDALARLPLALQRRLLRATAEDCGLRLSFSEVDTVLGLGKARSGAQVELAGGWLAQRGFAAAGASLAGPGRGRVPVLWFVPRDPDRAVDGAAAKRGEPLYALRLPIPGRVTISPLQVVVCITPVTVSTAGSAGYNEDQLLDPHSLGPELVIRNWRPGDRFWPPHTKSPKKVKELLQGRHITGRQRQLWPVLAKPLAAGAGEELVWMRDFPVPERFAAKPGAEQAVVVQLAAAGSPGGSLAGA